MKKFSDFFQEKLNEAMDMDMGGEKPRMHNYPPATIQKNRFGHLHIWSGDKAIVKSGDNYKTTDNQESDIYVQDSSDIDSILSNLHPDDREHVEKGFKLVTHDLPDDYFHQD